jgi:hypothetical protein
MGLRVVGVGLGRTGTNSLKLALEQLLGAPCHHMVEVFAHPDQIPLWTAAAAGEPDWPAIFEGYAATVDWPGAAFWRELVAEYPDAVVLLSRRESADDWWDSASRTIFEAFNGGAVPPPMASWFETLRELFAEGGIDPTDETSAKVGYERHLEAVRAEVPPERLVEWTTGDGWAPLCAALGVPVPAEPFPHVNTTEEFRARFEERVTSGSPDAGGDPAPTNGP